MGDVLKCQNNMQSRQQLTKQVGLKTPALNDGLPLGMGNSNHIVKHYLLLDPTSKVFFMSSAERLDSIQL